MTIKPEVFETIIEALRAESAYKLFMATVGMPEEHADEEPIALFWNLDEERLMLLPYATPSNGWAKIAESQNPWIHLGYYSGYDCMDGDPFGYIEGEISRLQKENY